MKKPLIILALLAMVIYGCQQIEAFTSSILNSSKLQSQLFTVDITKDTMLVTAKGAVIKIPKGALETSSGTSVTLEVKEAYSIQDIVKAGLTTMSNGQPLHSGGMIYINGAAGNIVKIIKPVFVATPTPYIDPGMQLFKGEVKQDSTINWTDPKPLPPNPQQAKLDIGKGLFWTNCATCHRIDKDLTGPALAHVTKRLSPYAGKNGGMARLYEWTKKVRIGSLNRMGIYPCRPTQKLMCLL
jgi:mono/diheme cytochrome c family protein